MSLNSTDLFSEVLLIEDEQSHAVLIKRALQDTVGEVVHASSGKEAIEFLTSQYFELVITDIHLGDATALELLRDIRVLRPGLPVLVMTSQNDLELAVQMMREGAWDFMVKTFTPDLAHRFRLSLDQMASRKMREIRETELTAERDAFAAAANSAEDGLAVLGDNGVITFENPSFARFLTTIGATESERDLSAMLRLVDTRAAEELESHLRTSVGNAVWTTEVHIEGEHPTFYSLSASTIALQKSSELPITFADGAYKRFVVWVKDITQRKEEERFQRDLLAATSHDLKGPLGAILSSTELLLEGGKFVQERSEELITRIASSTRGCIELIDELLSARRIQDGVLVIKPMRVSAAEILEDIHLDYLPTAKSRKVTFSVRQVDPTIKVYADRLGISRVLSNLVSNALKFTPTGGSVELSAQKVQGGSRITVKDSGAGIEPSERPLLFKKYSRLDKHRAVDGTGLGLFVTQNIVAAHNGKIEVQSEVGKGTSFTVTFPDPFE